MKTKNLLKVLSLTVLLGGLAKVSSFSDLKSAGSELFLESTQGTDMFDDCQVGLKLQGPRRSQESGDLLASDVKVQLSDVDENGNRSIRYVAAISSLAVDASFERTIYNEDGSVFAASSVKGVQYAYNSIYAGGEEVLPSSFGEGYNYFIVYTLGNVPESHWYHRIDVSVSVNSETSQRAANVEGVAKSYVADENLVYSERPGYSGQYQVSAANTDITSARISDNYVVYEDIVATRGKVTSIAKKGFQGCNSLEQLTIPSSITYFEEMCFDGVTYIENVNYYASSASMYSGVTMPDVGTLNFGANVTKIPNGMFLNNSIENLSYEGSKEEWDSIEKGDTNFSLEEVKCSDSALYTIVFHFEGATLNGKSDSYSYETHEGKTLVNPGSPEKDGESFDGWYLDENYENRFATVPASFPEGTNEVHVYAKFIADEGGMDAEHPLPLSLGTNEEREITSAFSHTYYSFTPASTDFYTFKDVSTDTSLSASGVWVYTSDMTQLGYKASSSSRFELSVALEQGQTYIVKAGSHLTTPTKFGKFQVSVFTRDGDQMSEAVAIEFNKDITNTYLGSSVPFYYEYTPDGTEEKPSNVRIVNTYNSTGNMTISLLDKETGNELDTVQFNKYSGTSAIKNKDFGLEVGKSYVFEVVSSRNPIDYTFKLSSSPKGTTASNPLEYSLSNGTVDIPFASNNNKIKDNDSSKYYFGIYYQFVATESFNGTLTVNNPQTTSSKDKGVVLEVFEDGVSVYTTGIMTSGTLDPVVELDFKSGSTYIINIKSILYSGSTSAYATTFSIVKNESADSGEEEVVTGGDSIEDPLTLENKLSTSSPVEVTLGAGQRKYYLVTVDNFFTDLLADSGFEIKLYSTIGRAQDDESSSANVVLSYNGYDSDTYIIEVYSANGGTTSLKIEDNYDLYNGY